jgi:hypothetical protein
MRWGAPGEDLGRREPPAKRSTKETALSAIPESSAVQVRDAHGAPAREAAA